MTKHKFYKEEPKTVRDTLNRAVDMANKIHVLEEKLIALLKEIEGRRYYVRYGFNSLRGFCVQGLQYTKTQGQRIATRVRRLPENSETLQTSMIKRTDESQSTNSGTP